MKKYGFNFNLETPALSENTGIRVAITRFVTSGQHFLQSPRSPSLSSHLSAQLTRVPGLAASDAVPPKLQIVLCWVAILIRGK